MKQKPPQKALSPIKPNTLLQVEIDFAKRKIKWFSLNKKKETVYNWYIHEPLKEGNWYFTVMIGSQDQEVELITKEPDDEDDSDDDNEENEGVEGLPPDEEGEDK